MTAKPRSSNSGRPITLTATVKNLSHAGGVPTGSVTFLDGTTILSSFPLRRGKASLRTSSLPVGRDPIQVDYDGAEDFTPSDSSTLIVTIRAHRSRTKAILSLASPRSKHLVPSKATVSGFGEGAALPGAAVTFLDGATALGTDVPDQGKAALTTNPPVGAHRIRPIYTRNADVYSSHTSPRKQTVKQSTTAASKPPLRLVGRD